MMTAEKILRIRKLEDLLDMWEERWRGAHRKRNYTECDMILKKQIEPLRKKIKREMGDKVSMRDQLKLGGMDDREISVISNEFIKLLLAVDYIANVSEDVKAKLKRCSIVSTNVSEAIDKVSKAAQAVGDDAVGNKRLRDTSIAMLICNDDDLLQELDDRLDRYINDSLTMYNQILNDEEAAEGEEH